MNSKKARVKIIKDNIQKGDTFPSPKNDGDVGHWVDQTLEDKGHKIDKKGILDLPEFGMDNKTTKLRTNAATTIGSMTKPDIVNQPDWYQTNFYKKALNHNQVVWDSDFNEVVSVNSIDYDLPDIQKKLEEAYTDLRDQLIQDTNFGNGTKKNYNSANGWAVLDGYSHHGSYKFRITNTAMKKIKNISATRDTFQKHFELVQL